MNHTPERALVGDVIDNPSLIPNIRRIVTSGEMFAEKPTGAIYDIVLSLYDDIGDIDLAALNPRVAKIGVEPAAILHYTAMANSGMADTHARLVAEGYVKRQTVAALIEVQKGLDSGDDVADAIGTATSLLNNLKRTFDKGKTVHVSLAVREAHEELDEIFSGKKSMGIPFGFVDLDRHTGGMDNGDLVVIAAPEKSGKSTLMIQVMFNVLAKGVPCLLFSTEMTRRQILYRKALMDTQIRWIDVKNNMCTEEQAKRLSWRLHEMASLPLFIRQGSMSIIDIIGDTERYVRERGVKMIAVDYIQRVVPVSKKSNENREREVAAISSGLKSIALDYNIPVMALSQVNDDLRARESRAIEQDMDKMILIGNKPEVADGARGVMTDIKLRQRMGLSGNMGDIALWYDLMQGSWHNATNKHTAGLQTEGMPF